MSNAPTFQHRHYKLLADTIATIDDDVLRARVAILFAERLLYTNPKYSPTRFYAAAVGTPSNGRDKVR